MAQCDESFGFIVEWFDSQAELIRRYRLTYFVKQGRTNEIELFDLKNQRVFLKRVAFPAISVDDLFIGSKLTVYARQLTIVEYCDDFTKKKFGQSRNFVALVLGALQSPSLGRAVSEIEGVDELRICQMKMLRLDPADAAALAKEAGIPGVGAALANGHVLALELMHSRGPAVWSGPGSSNNDLGIGEALKTKYRLQSVACAANQRLSQLLFSSPGPQHHSSAGPLPSASRPTARFSGCTCCVIKPHAVRSRVAGSIISDILQQGAWTITGLKMVQLDIASAKEFLEVYKGVISSFNDHAVELCSGQCIAMEVCGKNAVSEFRKLAGPLQWDFAKQLRPETLRAKYGSNNVRNGVHCTDLPEDGVSESEFFFQIMS